MRRVLAVSRWSRVVIGLFVLATLIAACSVLLDHNKNQCNGDSDCLVFGGHPTCVDNVCVGNTLGPPGCFFGTPMAPSDFANQCSTATCTPFDNCKDLQLCAGDTGLPNPVTPPTPDAGVASTVDAAPPPVLPDCVDPKSRNTIVLGGSTAIQPFLAVMAPLLAANSTPYQIAYQPSGSCTGADGMFSPDPTKIVIKDIVGKQALLYHTDGTSEPCTFANGDGTINTSTGAPNPVHLDVAASDVYANSCTGTYMPSDSIAEYLALIQPMTFVVPANSSETSISAEKAHFVFGLGSSDMRSDPYDNPSLYFVRNAGSGTQQMIARAINVPATGWWGIDRGGSGPVRDKLMAVAGDSVNSAIGILSTDFADPVRGQLRILAFQATGQLCGYYPDSTQFTRDKKNVRDGHYSIWGPEHFFARVSGGVPSDAAGAFVSRFTTPKLDQTLLDAIIKSGLVPACAMDVKRDTEMGAIEPFSPEFHCGCYFEATVPGGSPSPDCSVCKGPADCPSSRPACNNGFCEIR